MGIEEKDRRRIQKVETERWGDNLGIDFSAFADDLAFPAESI